MAVLCELAKVVEVYLDFAVTDGAAEDAVVEGTLEERGEEGDEVEAHGSRVERVYSTSSKRPGGSCIRIRLAARSTSSSQARTKGTRTGSASGPEDSLSEARTG